MNFTRLPMSITNNLLLWHAILQGKFGAPFRRAVNIPKKARLHPLGRDLLGSENYNISQARRLFMVDSGQQTWSWLESFGWGIQRWDRECHTVNKGRVRMSSSTLWVVMIRASELIPRIAWEPSSVRGLLLSRIGIRQRKIQPKTQRMIRISLASLQFQFKS